MADFFEVHRAKIDTAMAKFAPRKGDHFCIPLLRPIEAPAKTRGDMFEQMNSKVHTVVLRRIDAGGKWLPATDEADAAIKAWAERYRNEPAAAFVMPDPWGDRFAPPPEDMP